MCVCVCLVSIALAFKNNFFLDALQQFLMCNFFYI